MSVLSLYAWPDFSVANTYDTFAEVKKRLTCWLQKILQGAGVSPDNEGSP